MPGKNAFAFTGSAFVPTDRNQTGVIRARPTASTFSGVKSAKNLSANTSIWNATPPVVTNVNVAFSRQGTFPNHYSAYVISWTLPTQTSLITGFDVFVSVNNGAWTALTNNLPANTTSYTHAGPSNSGLAAGTNYKYYVRTNYSTASLVSSTGETGNNSIAAPGTVSAITLTGSAWNSLTWKFTYPANTYQRFHIYNTQGAYIAEILPPLASTEQSYSFTNLAENVNYGIRVYGQNINGHWSANLDKSDTTPWRCDSTGIINNADSVVYGLGCGACGTQNRYVRNVCGTTTYAYSNCSENGCGCAGNIAEVSGQSGNNGWIVYPNHYNDTVGCGVCGTKTQYADLYQKGGCNPSSIQGPWKGYGACGDAGDCVTYGAAPCTTHYTDVTESVYGHWNNVSFMGLRWSYRDYTMFDGGSPVAKGLTYLNAGGWADEHFSECCGEGAQYGCTWNCGLSCCSCYPKFYRAYKCNTTEKVSFVFMRCVYVCLFGCTNQ